MSRSRPTSLIDTIIIHCADTPNGSYRSAEDVDDWHRERSFNRELLEAEETNVSPHLKHIGYHFVIETTGQIRQGRSLEETGAHAKGYNTNSIGICLIGLDAFTHEQWESLRVLVLTLQDRFKNKLSVIGHNNVDQAKTCPGFNVTEWLHNNMMPRTGCLHLYGH